MGPLAVALAPASILLLLFFVVPAIWVVYASVTQMTFADVGGTRPAFVGLQHYRDLLRDPNTSLVIRNSLVYIAGSAVIGQSLLGMGLALLVDHAHSRRLRLAGVAYGAVLVAWISPLVLTGFLWARMFTYYDGTVNALFQAVGAAPVDWFGSSPMLVVVLAEVWRGTAFAMLLFLGALRTVPADVYEAARVDGANAWQRFSHHTLPTIRGVAMLVLVMTTIFSAGSFLVILVLTNGGPAFLETTTLALYAYKNAFERFAISYGAAIAVVMLLMNLGFVLIYLLVARLRGE